MTIGKRIQKARKEAGYTQRELAEKCQLKAGTIQQYELDKREPRIAQLIQIAEILNVSVIELAGRGDSTFKKEIVRNSYELDLLNAFNELNDSGKQRAVSQVQLVAAVPEFRKGYKSETELFEVDESD